MAESLSVTRYAAIHAASSGDNAAVAAVEGARIRVLDCLLIASDTVTVRFESSAGGAALTGQMQLAANGGFASGFNPEGHFQTEAGEALNLELSEAVSVDGWIVYKEVTEI